MKKIECTERVENDIGEKSTAMEYPFEVKDASISVIEIFNRHPKQDRAVNKKCKEFAYILNAAQSRLVVEGEVYRLSKGDAVVIEPGEEFFWHGHPKMVMFCVPAWSPEQHEIVDN